MNPYLYAKGNPLVFIDPFGLNTQHSIGLSGTLVAFLGGNANANVGISVPDNPWDVSGYQLFFSEQVAGLLGVGIYGGVGVSLGKSTSPGPLTAGVSATLSPYVEGDIGIGDFSTSTLSVGASATITPDPQCPTGPPSVSTSTSPPLRVGEGLGIFAGGGGAATITVTTPTAGQIGNAISNAYQSFIWNLAGLFVK